MNKRIFIKDINNIECNNNCLLQGRVVSLNKNSFFLSDQSGEISVLLNDKNILFKIGDIIEITVTNKNNKIYLENYKILNSISVNYINNFKTTYYKLNKNSKRLIEVLYKRQSFFYFTREFFIKKGFLEMHTPTLVESPGIEKHIEPFWTTYLDHKGRDHLFFLPSSPEFSLKEALSCGLEKIFEIAKVFRNYGEDSDFHNPEFFMLEWYRSFEGYEIIMKDCLDYLLFLSNMIYQNNQINFKKKVCKLDDIKKVKVKDLFKDHDIDLDNYMTNKKKFIKEISDVLNLSRKHISESNLTEEDLFFKFFLTNIEPNLGFDNPVIIYEYPVDMAALSAVCDDNDCYAKRFELYICGIEIANAYEELIDPIEQKKRFDEILSFRSKNRKINLHSPERFYNILNFGIPPCSGIALGLERLFMLFEGLSSIKNTNLFF
ncbi:MAG: hypothetical protein JXB50_03675 [Spirochaetes bacterium]|nr:hypothetical protein [Spirochaetota bacterium]